MFQIYIQNIKQRNNQRNKENKKMKQTILEVFKSI